MVSRFFGVSTSPKARWLRLLDPRPAGRAGVPASSRPSLFPGRAEDARSRIALQVSPTFCSPAAHECLPRRDLWTGELAGARGSRPAHATRLRILRIAWACPSTLASTPRPPCCFSPSSMRARSTIWRLTIRLSWLVASPAKTRARSSSAWGRMSTVLVWSANIATSASSGPGPLSCSREPGYIYVSYIRFISYIVINIKREECRRRSPDCHRTSFQQPRPPFEPAAFRGASTRAIVS
jgi:hypothetical protein